MKKVVCPNCSHVIEVEDDKEGDVFCSDCGINFLLEDGIKAKERNFKLAKNKGYKEYLELDFKESNENYEEALKLKPEDFECLTQIALNKLYLNTFRKTHFCEIKELFESVDITLNDSNTYLFLSFMKDYVQNIGVYLNEVNERLFADQKFINEVYLSEFHKSLKDILDSLTYLEGIYPLLKEEAKSVYLEDNPEFSKKLEERKEIINKLLISKFIVLGKGEVQFTLQSFEFNKDSKDDGTPILLDEERVLVPNYKYKKRLRLFYIVVLSLLGVAAIFLILGTALKISILSWLSLIPAGILVIFLIVFYKKMRS